MMGTRMVRVVFFLVEFVTRRWLLPLDVILAFVDLAGVT